MKSDCGDKVEWTPYFPPSIRYRGIPIYLGGGRWSDVKVKEVYKSWEGGWKSDPYGRD